MASDRISPPSALLLLPPPPSISFDQFKTVYERILSRVFAALLKSLNGSNRIASLDIALSLPGLQSAPCQPPTRAFGSLQRIVEHIYRLIGVVCTERNIEMEAPGGIDARVVLLDFDSVRRLKASSHEPATAECNGPIVDLKTLASSGRLWDDIFYPDNPVGQDLATAFRSCYPSKEAPGGGGPQPVAGSPQWNPGDSLVVPGEAAGSGLHHSVILGGTFDHFHIGHKLLLTATALVLQPAGTGHAGQERSITVGVTGDEMLKNKKYAQFLESWEERCRSTGNFLTSIMDFGPPERGASRIEQIYKPGPNGRAMVMKIRPEITLKLVQILDPYGPTITEEDLTALVVSRETRSGGAAVNQERAKRGWKQLDVFEVDVIHSADVSAEDVEDFASKISSTDIRRRRMELAMI
ncbi:putative pantetheine-phosphate adenylyltransferase [Aspergillus lucknowensis]|uniref:Cytidyltransferase-like domain-containing protein n=1 Tax=Aspergillus lucknowensis TaxID=176173 RepID=A0ABR4M0T1_9EURO